MEQQLLAISKQLSELTKDRSKFFPLSSVLVIYLEFKSVLDNAGKIDATAWEKAPLSDVTLMFSLAFLALGIKQHPVAAFAKAVAMVSLFKCTLHDTAMTPKELSFVLLSVRHKDEELKRREFEDIPEISAVTEEVLRLVSESKAALKTDIESLKKLPEDEIPMFIQIIHTRRDILSAVVASDVDQERLDYLQQKLVKIRAHIANSHKPVSTIVKSTLKKADQCYEWYKNGMSGAVVAAEDPELKNMFLTLQKILPDLNVLVMTWRWTVRGTDLFEYISALVHIFHKLQQGNRHQLQPPAPDDDDGKMLHLSPLDPETKCLHLVQYMLRRGLTQIYKLLSTSEPVAEALSPIYNQLLTMKRCLLEVQKGCISNMRELYPYQMKLNSLDNLRTDGKFEVDGEIPPGQGILISLLTDCFDLVYEMEVELDEDVDEDADDSLLAGEEEDENEYNSDVDSSDEVNEDRATDMGGPV